MGQRETAVSGGGAGALRRAQSVDLSTWGWGCPGSTCSTRVLTLPIPMGAGLGKAGLPGWERGAQSRERSSRRHPRSPPYQESPGDKRDNSSLAPARSPHPAERAVPALGPQTGLQGGTQEGVGEPERAAGLRAGTWAQASGGQCWAQTLLPPRQRQLAQASCHSDPGWGQQRADAWLHLCLFTCGLSAKPPHPKPSLGAQPGQRAAAGIGNKNFRGEAGLGGPE